MVQEWNKPNSRSIFLSMATNSCSSTTTTHQQGIIERGRRIKMAAEAGLARSSRRRALRQRSGGCACEKERGCGLATKAEAVMEGVGSTDGEKDEVEVERKVRALQRLVPGGEALEMERLFEETAQYIEALEVQVSVMRALASFLDGLEKEKRVMGG